MAGQLERIRGLVATFGASAPRSGGIAPDRREEVVRAVVEHLLELRHSFGGESLAELRGEVRAATRNACLEATRPERA